MNVKRTARVAVIAAGLTTSALALGTGSVSAVPLDPPPTPPPVSPAPEPPPPGQIALPQSGGSQHGGHALPQQSQPGPP